MSKFNIIVPHKLKKEAALAQSKKLMSEIQKAYPDDIKDLRQDEWIGHIGDFNCIIKGIKVNGSLHVRDREIELSGNIPFFATPYKGTIEAKFREQAERILNSPEPQEESVVKNPLPINQNPSEAAPTDLIGYCKHIHNELMDCVKKK